jgi:multiple sugar transport system substrate-binding protein
MAIDGQWAIGTDLITALDTGLRYGVGVLPKFKEAVTTGSGGTTVVYKTTKYPKETMEFVRWFAQEDNYFPLIETGVYTPVHENWYHDEALIKRWADNKYHPPVEEYKTAVVDYILNNYKKYPWFYFAGISRLEDMLDLKVVWSGEKTAKQAIDEVYPSMKSLFDELKGIN